MNEWDLLGQALAPQTPGGSIQDLVAAWGAPPPNPGVAQTPMGWLPGFAASAVQSVPELIGKPTWGQAITGVPAEQVEQWRAENPWSSLASQIVGPVPVYGAAMKAGAAIAARAAPALWESLGATSAAGLARPVITAWQREAVALTPFEAARVAAAAAVGDTGELDNVALSAGLDLALIPVIPGAWKAFNVLRGSDETSATRALRNSVPEITRDSPLQLQLAKAIDLRAGAAPVELHKILDDGINALELQIRSADAKEPLGELVGTGDASALRKFFKAGVKKGEGEAEVGTVRKLYQAVSGGYDSPKAWQDEIAPLALPKDWLAYSEFPRVVEAKTAAKAAGYAKDFEENLLPMPKGWYMRGELDTGLYVMAKKVVGSIDETGPGDKWFVVKTSQPSKLIGEDLVSIRNDRAVKFSQKVKAAEDREVMQTFQDDLQGSVVHAGRSFDNSIPLEKVRDLPANNLQRAVKLFDAWLPGTAKAANAMHADLRDAFTLAKRFVSPAMAQFRKTPMAESTRLRAQARFDAAEAQKNAILFGTEGLKDWERPLARVFATSYEPGGLAKVFQGITSDDMKIVTKLLNEEVPVSDIAKALAAVTEDAGTRARIQKLFETLDKLDQKLNRQVNFTEKLYREPETQWLANHYGVNHTWTGSLRRRITDEAGTLIAVASGRNPVELEANAKALQARFGGKIGKERLSGDEHDDALARELFANKKLAEDRLKLGGKPLTFTEERLGIRGYVGDIQPLTKQELFDILQRNITKKFRYQAELSVKHDLTPDLLESYSRYGKEVGDQLVTRINQQAGRKGAFDQATNKAVTRVLGKFLGTNSADKLVGAYNQAEFTLSLLAFNMAHPALQAMTFVQTVLPKVAMFRGAPPGRWGEIMGIMPEVSADGRVTGMVSTLDPILLTAKAMKGLVKPSNTESKMLARAASDGVIAPKFLEEFIGQKSLFGESVKEAALSGSNPVLKYLKKWSEFPATKMEELSRTHAFLTGHNLASRLAPDASDEWRYQFAKQFTFRTMYQYSAADRPKLFAGPLGGLYGLFKNWMFHNIADWGNYAGEAFLRNNWAPLLWALGGQTALGGIASVPLIGLANGAHKIFSDQSAMQGLYENFGSNRATDAAYFGLPALFGVSLQANASGPFSNPTRDINYMFNAAVVDRAAKVGKFLGYVGDQQGLGSNPFESDRTWDLAAYALGPRLLYKGLAQVEDGALKAIRNGQPIIEGITFPEAVINAVGFTPMRIAKAYELSEELWANRERARAQTSRLAEAFAQGVTRGDEKVMNFVVGTAIAHGYDLAGIMRGASNRLANQTQTILPYEFRKDELAWKGLQVLGVNE